MLSGTAIHLEEPATMPHSPSTPRPRAELRSAARAAITDFLHLSLSSCDGHAASDRAAALRRAGRTIAKLVNRSGAASPRKAIAAVVREHLRAHREFLDEKTCATLAQRLRAAALRARMRRVQRRAARRAPLDVVEVSERYGLSEAAMREALRTLDGRRAFGWPLYRGEGEWIWRREWVDDPAMHSARTRLPEPPHPVALPADHEPPQAL